MNSTPKSLELVKNLFSKLTASEIDLVDAVYAENCTFIDPVVELRGREQLKAHLKHQYEGCLYARFEYDGDIVDDQQAVIQWRMKFAHPKLNQRKEIVVPGVSVLRWNTDNKITYHRDYYDISQFIYEQLPVVGQLIHKMKMRLTPKVLRS